MKRIKAACLEQTIHFELKEGLEPSKAAELAREELAGYKAALERKRVKYKIVEETPQPDGSILLKIKKQYNFYSCGDYLR
ncbi:MAG: hypothetical protein DBX66_01130 [Clostridiales bacterium]|uniref:hypothetical protein n=1 Tax=Provencibacterium massiliense TaxID=1841868 RepID=UPI0009A7E1BE|nr:hypothetical protein [Provencibacterium massiliense]PWM40106.1 MAG: hypothetical protein DBX66_01130 [Clostridiales bacterium]RGB66741.1 hypothetical protein DW086_08055 [Harryflintia acetispora]